MSPLARLYLWATRRLYNEFAWAYDLVAWLVSGGRWDRWRRLALDYIDDGRVLEIGFGTGELLLTLAAQGQDVTGLELSLAMQRITARKMQRRGLWTPRVRGATQRLPFANGAFATVISTFPAEYILDAETLREIYRVLQPGGRLVIAGLVVLMEHGWWSRCSRLVFGALPESPLTRWERHAEQLGFAVTVDLRDDPPVRVPVIVAEKQL